MDCEPTAWRKERRQTTTSFNTELVVVWIGSGSGAGSEEVGWHFLCMLPLGCSMIRKGRQGVQAASGQLGCLAAWPYNSLLVGCLARWMTAEQETQKHATINGPNINSPIHCIIPKVWINSLGKVSIGGLDRLWDRGLIQTLHFEPQPCVYTSESFRFNHLPETLALSAKIETNMFCSANYLKHHKDFSSLRSLEAIEHQSYFIPVWWFWHCSNRPAFLTQLCFSCF